MNRKTYVDARDAHGRAVTVEFSEIESLSGGIQLN